LIFSPTAAEFQRKLGEFQHQAQREPVEITRHGRRELVLMSADHYDWLMAADAPDGGRTLRCGGRRAARGDGPGACGARRTPEVADRRGNPGAQTRPGLSV
jgi:prevent-host-death family protein